MLKDATGRQPSFRFPSPSSTPLVMMALWIGAAAIANAQSPSLRRSASDAGQNAVSAGNDFASTNIANSTSNHVANHRTRLRETPTVLAVRRASPSVVNIHGEKLVRQSAASMTGGASRGNSRSVNGMGTGVIIDPRGYIITNYHVVQDVADIRVTLNSGKTTGASLVAAKIKNDLALIKLDDDAVTSPLPTIPRGRSDDLMVGENVIAIGNAFGYVHTTTQGIISALHRDVPVNDTQEYRDLIQISAGINPGNSGGPLLNIHGEIIGINVAVRVGAQQIAFAIPIDQVIDTVTQMIDHRTETRLAIGFRADGGPRDGDGVSVTHVVASGPAAREGLRPGDRVVRVGTRPIDDKLDLALAMIDHRSGQPLDFSVVREGRQYDLALRTDSPAQVDPADLTWEVLGLRARPVSSAQLARMRRQFGADYEGGLQIVEVRPGSAAQRSMIQRNDILVGIHGFQTVTIEDLPMIFNEPSVQGSAKAKFLVIRSTEILYGHMNIASAGAGPSIR